MVPFVLKVLYCLSVIFNTCQLIDMKLL